MKKKKTKTPKPKTHLAEARGGSITKLEGNLCRQHKLVRVREEEPRVRCGSSNEQRSTCTRAARSPATLLPPPPPPPRRPKTNPFGLTHAQRPAARRPAGSRRSPFRGDERVRHPLFFAPRAGPVSGHFSCCPRFPGRGELEPKGGLL